MNVDQEMECFFYIATPIIFLNLRLIRLVYLEPYISFLMNMSVSGEQNI
jgi:hypothetical protein